MVSFSYVHPTILNMGLDYTDARTKSSQNLLW
jgi:hypothetical protein